MPVLIYGQESPADGGKSRPVLIDDQRRLVVTGAGGGGGSGPSASDIGAAVGNNLRSNPPVERGLPNFVTSVVSVGTSSVQVLAARATRGAAMLVNKSTSGQTIGIQSGTAVLSSAFKLPPNGVLTINTTAAISAIASAASGSLEIVETLE